jgi:hypothetical protein
MLKKTSQFSGKGKPNTQHLNPSESALAIPLLSLLFVGFLISFFLIPGRYFTPLSQKGKRVGGEGN